MPTLSIPNLSLVVLIGPSGAGKSTFARRHFRPTEVLSSDYCRGLVSDDENAQAATKDAFDVLHYIAAKRLAAGRLTVVDATNVQLESRQPLVSLARGDGWAWLMRKTKRFPMSESAAAVGTLALMSASLGRIGIRLRSAAAMAPREPWVSDPCVSMMASV